MTTVTRNRFGLLCCSIALLIACVVSARHAPSLSASVRQQPIQYTMTVDVDYDKAFLNVTQVVQFPNRTDAPLSSLVFNVPPVAFNAFTLASISAGETPLTVTQDGAMLDVALPRPLAPGDAATVTMRWGGQLPSSNGRYGAADGVLVLGDWYPRLAVLQNGVWFRHQYTPIGDAFFSEVADYDVTVNAPANVIVAASGSQVSHNGGQWLFHSENARDVALAISSRFQTQTRKVDNVALTVYSYGDGAEAAKTSLDIAEQAMRWYTKRIGPYPYATLAIVQTPGDENTAQEHAGMFFIRTSSFTTASVGIYTAHELAHAWFFGAVGNDQIDEPWLDEALVNSASLDFYKENRAKEYPALWSVWGGSAEDFKSLPAMDLAITDFKPGEGNYYFSVVYRQGAAFFKAVREAMGDDAYWQALQQYYAEFTFRIARPQDLLRALRQASPKADLVPVFVQYLDYPYLAYPNLSVDIAGTDGQTLEGQVLVPITVTADSPTYTVSVMLDSNVITASNRAAPVAVDTAPLRDGQHALRVIADDDGLNHVEVQRLFKVVRPTPTPLPTSTRAATQTPGSAASPTAPASPLLTPSAPITSGPSNNGNTMPWVIVAVPIGIVVVVAAAALRRRRRW